MRPIGSQSMVDELNYVIVKHPRHSHVDQANVDAQWQALNYLSRPDLGQVLTEFDEFVSLLNGFGTEIGTLPPSSGVGLDSIYTHDPVVITNRGAILCTMGKAARLVEADAFAAYLRSMDVPILGRIEPPGTLEGGDVCWIDERTVAVGEGYRTNAEGIRQFRALLGDAVDEVIPVPLPHWNGPDECLHLLSLISPVDHDLAVVYSRLMPVPFRQWLLARGIHLIEVPDEEYDSFACNVLTVSPGKVIMIAGNPITQSRLEAAGVEVSTFSGQDLCIKGGGGPTCLTRPVLRTTNR
ncbi:amidinotransferase [bacterium]|nr:amidinotransferase [bacterium]